MQSYVLSIIGADRAGLVDALSEIVAEHGGNWERSHMTELAGMFAGMVLVHLPPDRAHDFEESLALLRERGLLEVTLRAVSLDAGTAPDGAVVTFEVVGADRPGIVHEVSHLLASMGVGIIDLRTWTESSAMAAEPLFRAAATVRLPEATTRAELASSLEGLAEDLMVDLTED